ncbi:MAG: alpha/beta fold hydrolase [bacterium]
MRFKSLGAGKTILLLHAFPLSNQLWKDLLPPPGYRLFLPDFPGFGDSPLPQGDTDFTRLSQALQTHLKALKIDDRIILGGISMGGYWALEYTRLFQDQVEKLILISTRAGVDSPEGRQNRLAMAEKVEQEGTREIVEAMVPGLLGKTTLDRQPDVVSILRQWIQAAPPSGVALAQRVMAGRRDQTDLLPALRIPTLILAGQEDALIAPQESQNMAEKIRDVRLKILGSTGHLLSLENPDQFQAILNDFVQ